MILLIAICPHCNASCPVRPGEKIIICPKCKNTFRIESAGLTDSRDFIP